MSDSNSEVRQRKYNISNIPTNFLDTDMCRHAIIQIVDALQVSHQNQHVIDNMYDSLCQCIFHEMDSKLDFRDFPTCSRKRKISKPFWSRELSSLWKDLRDKERKFLKCHCSKRLGLVLRHEF